MVSKNKDRPPTPLLMMTGLWVLETALNLNNIASDLLKGTLREGLILILFGIHLMLIGTFLSLINKATEVCLRSYSLSRFPSTIMVFILGER